MAEFEVIKIPKKIFKKMQGKSYSEECWLDIDDLRLLNIKYHNYEGQDKNGQLICNKYIADDILEIFKKLYDSNYQISSIELIDKYDGDNNLSMEANNSSCFNYRLIEGTEMLSKHSMGLAIDINPVQNPVVDESCEETIIKPDNAAAYTNRLHEFPYKIDKGDLAYKLFTEKNFIWGGNWDKKKNYQHFEVSDEFVSVVYPNFNPKGSTEDNANAGGDRTRKIVPIYQTKVFAIIMIVIFLAIILIGLSIGLTGYGC